MITQPSPFGGTRGGRPHGHDVMHTGSAAKWPETGHVSLTPTPTPKRFKTAPHSHAARSRRVARKPA